MVEAAEGPDQNHHKAHTGLRSDVVFRPSSEHVRVAAGSQKGRVVSWIGFLVPGTQSGVCLTPVGDLVPLSAN